MWNIGTKGENDDINGRCGRNQSSPKKAPNQISSFNYFIFKSQSGQWQSFCDSPTTKVNVKDDDILNSAQRHEGMWEEQG